MTDLRGDVIELLDEDGERFGSYRYNVWGMHSSGLKSTATSAIGATLAAHIVTRQILRYASYAYDQESGFYYCSARYYDPATRQWTTGDPAKADGEESAYQYCGGEPVGKVDATGEYAHPFVPTVGDQTRYFLKVLQVNAGRVWKRARTMWLWDFAWWFQSSVRTGRAWDLKQCMGRDTRDQTAKVFRFMGRRISLDDFGNMHFGYICHSMPLDRRITVFGAGAYSVAHIRSKGVAKVFRDAFEVDYGWRLFGRYGREVRSDSQLDRFIYAGYRTVIGYRR